LTGLRRQLDLRPLEDPRVRRLALAHFASATGDSLVLAALPFVIHAAGGSDSQFAVALAVQALMMAALFLPAGLIGDRCNRRSVVVAADLMRFGARGAFAVLLIMGDATFWQLLLAQAVNGAGTALFNTTMDGFVPEVFDQASQLQKINALRILALSLGLTLGPAIGGLVYVASGAASVFAMDALTFLASAALICRLPAQLVEATSEPPTLRALIDDVKEGWSAFRAIHWYWRVATEFAVINTLVFAPFFVIGPHVAEESLGGSSAWAAILAGLGVGELIGVLIAMAWQPQRPLLVATSVVALWVLPLLLLAALAPVPVLAAGSVLAGVSFAMFGAIWETVKQTQTPPHLRARLGSFDHLGSLGLVPLGYVLGGAMLSLVGAPAALLAGASVLAVATLSVIVDPSIRILTPNGNAARAPRASEIALAGIAGE
jgi:MFS family permease